MDEAIYLREEIIHHILSYLNPKEKVQAALLSKEWLTAWQTNPNLEFDARYFESLYHLYKYVNSTLARYQKGHVQEMSFALNFYGTKHYFRSVLCIIFGLALKVRVKLVRLVICGCNQIYTIDESIPQVPELLMDIQVRFCKLRKQSYENKFRYNLRSLHLEEVYIDDEMLGCFMLGCPLINRLIIDRCEGLNTIKLINLRSLKELRILHLRSENPTVEVDAPSLEVVDLQYLHRPHLLELGASGNLKVLYLIGTYIADAFFDDFANKFPCLECLKVDSCSGFKRIILRSHLMKQIRLLHLSKETKEVEIFAPNLVKLDYGGAIFLEHQFSFTGVFSGQCVSNISINCGWNSRDDESWFLKLHQLLSSLSPSKVSIHMDCFFQFECHKYMGNIPTNANTDVIEGGELDLVIWSKSSTRDKSDFLDGLFWACRPKTILLHWVHYGSEDLIEFLYKKLVAERRKRKFHYRPPTAKFWEDDLKKVEFVMYDIYGKEYYQQEPLDWSLLGLLGSKIIFKLEWDVNSTERETQESEALKLEHCGSSFSIIVRNWKHFMAQIFPFSFCQMKIESWKNFEG